MLNNEISKNLKQDKNAKSASFYYSGEITKVDKRHILFLIEYSKENSNCDVRLCIHDNPDNKHHDMIILARKYSYGQPHKHLEKNETAHVMSGKMAAVTFYDNGDVRSIDVLNQGDIYRMPKNTFHTYVTISNRVIFHETKAGPFLKESESIFAEWALPRDVERKEVIHFHNLILDQISKK